MLCCACKHNVSLFLWLSSTIIHVILCPPFSGLFDSNLESNTEQYQAIQHIVAGSSRPAPYLVFGPPGTGKASALTLSGAQQYGKNNPKYFFPFWSMSVCLTVYNLITLPVLKSFPAIYKLSTAENVTQKRGRVVTVFTGIMSASFLDYRTSLWKFAFSCKQTTKMRQKVYCFWHKKWLCKQPHSPHCSSNVCLTCYPTNRWQSQKLNAFYFILTVLCLFRQNCDVGGGHQADSNEPGLLPYPGLRSHQQRCWSALRADSDVQTVPLVCPRTGVKTCPWHSEGQRCYIWNQSHHIKWTISYSHSSREYPHIFTCSLAA